MKKSVLLSVSIALLLFAAIVGQSRQEVPDPSVSGRLLDGYRVLTVPVVRQQINYTVYRGDYVKFKLEDARNGALLTIPALSIRQSLPGNFSEAPYFKMKTTGTYELGLDGDRGQISVIDYRQPSYRELTVDQAAVILENEQPLLLDVRTRAEYERGHLAGSILIPVQELQRRAVELDAYKDRDILLYCATGNRSTVASKILIDRGFKHISNMRHGIVAWSKDHPVVR